MQRAFNVADVLRDMDANFLIIEEGRQAKEPKQGGPNVTYHTVKFNINGRAENGWFTFKDEIVITSVPTPILDNPSQKKREYEIHSRLSCSGSYGAFMAKLNDLWLAKVNEMVGAKKIKATRQAIVPLINKTYSENHKINPGGVIEDPYVKIKFSFEHYPESCKKIAWMVGPKTKFLDYEKRIYHNGKVVNFEPLMFFDEEGREEALTADNYLKYITPGCIIKHATLNITNVTVVTHYITLKFLMTRMIIKRAPPPGLIGEDDFDDIVENDSPAPVEQVEQQETFDDILEDDLNKEIDSM